MAIGDADLAAFFRDFGVPVSFSNVSTYPNGEPIKGNLDAPGKDAAFDQVEVANIDYRLELPWNAFSPFPRSKQQIQVLAGPFAGTYVVHKADPVDDGLTVELRLRKQ